MLEHLGRDHVVEAAVGKRKRERVGPHRPEARAGRRLARVRHRRERGQGAEQVGVEQVRADDVRAAPVRLERVAARSRAEVEQAGPWPHAEPVEVDGQHFMTSR